MPRLIINADDLGVNVQRSHGIFQCFEFGVVRSASIIPNGTDSDDAARHARERKLSSGLHINLTDDYPLSDTSDVPTLIDVNGKFLGQLHLHELLDEGAIEKTSLERELRAQVEWMFDNYGSPTHISSHHHIHLHPSIIDALLPILDRYGIRFVRIPDESPLPPYGYEITKEEWRAVEGLNKRAVQAREIYHSQGIQSTDHFRGSTLLGNASLKNLRHILSRLPEGVTELMVHPGSQTAYGTPFDLDPQRQTELRMLLDPTIPEMLKEKKIEICSFGEL